MSDTGMYRVYLMVSEALNLHDLDCRCYICTAFVNAENGSKGHAAACKAVADHLVAEESAP